MEATDTLPRLLRRGAIAVSVGTLYLAMGVASVLYTRFEGGGAFIWPSGAIALAALICSARRYWAERLLALGIASFLTTALFSLGVQAAIPLACMNIFEAVFGALILRRMQPDFGQIGSVGETIALIVIAGVVVPIVGSFGGAAVITAYTPVGYWTNWFAWYTGHALGMIMLTPLAVLMFRGDATVWVRTAGRTRRAEATCLLALLGIVVGIVFGQDILPLLFLPFPIMVASVFRYGRLGATLSVLVLAFVACSFTIAGHGPIAATDGSDALHALLMQTYLATAVLTVLPIAGDLRKRKRTMEDLEGESTLYRLVVDGSGDVILMVDLLGTIQFASPSAREVIGIEAEGLVGTLAQSLVHPDDLARTIAIHDEAVRHPAQTLAVDYRVCRDGHELGWFESQVRAMLDAEQRPTGVVCIVRDISHRKEIERALTNVAMTDPLTGIANRRAFDAALEKRFDNSGRATPAVLALFDLDHFKQVNDVHGHAVGDRVLRQFASILQSELRARDLPARIGGEEFVTIINGDLAAGRAVCERIRRRLAECQIELENGRTLRVTVSAGVIPVTPTESPKTSMEAADRALYSAKREGRNRLNLAA